MVLKKTKDVYAPKIAAKAGGNNVKAKMTDYPSTNGANIAIDYPTEGETLKGIHYSVRIAATGQGTPQISFDGNDWKNCRQDGGYWWFDWAYFTPGSYKINARLVDNNGNVIKKTSTRCRVA